MKSNQTSWLHHRASIIRFVVLVLMFAAAPVFAQSVEFSSSLNPVGSGARATGMGGAFIGVADDATAASWNPAGIAQLERPEVSVVYDTYGREQTYSSLSHTELAGAHEGSDNSINYLSAVFDPFELAGHKTVVSVNYQRLYEMRKKVDIRYNYETANPADSLPLTITFSQEGYLYALSPAIAMQVSPSLNIGATFNFWKDYLGANGWSRVTRTKGAGTIAGGTPYTMDVQERETVNFDGANMHLGFLWNAAPSITIGGVVKTGFDARLTKARSTVDNTLLNGAYNGASTDVSSQQTMKMPLSYGLGFQYRVSDSLTLALDAYRTDWSRFLLQDATGSETNPLTSASLSEGTLRPTTQVRLGTEYLMIGNDRSLALRAGLFSDPEPAMGKVDTYYGFSLGTGYSTKRFALDAAYQYRIGKNVTGDLTTPKRDVTMDVTQQQLMVSVIHYY